MTDAELNDMEADAQRELAACGAYYVPHCVGYTLALVAEVRRLKALVPNGETYRVKPLEWVASKTSGCYWCSTALGEYGVVTCSDTGKVSWWRCHYAQFERECLSVEDGMRAAEQHYQERLTRALEVA
jgi:hypothetical protein